MTGARGEDSTVPAIGVENLDTWPGTVKARRMFATTATGVVTFPGIAGSPKREIRPTTPAEKQATWAVMVTMLTSRNATPAEKQATWPVIVDMLTHRSATHAEK